MEEKINSLTEQLRVIQSDRAVIQYSKDERKDKEKLRVLSQLWLKYLRTAKFEEADRLLSQYMGSKFQKGIDYHAVDEFGKNALYYAVAHHNYLLSHKLAVEYQINTTQALSILPPHRDDLKEALTISHSTERATAWTKVIEIEITNDFNKLMLGNSNETINQLQKKYNKYGWGSVYDGKEWTSIFNDVLKKYIQELKQFLKNYIWGYVNADIDEIKRYFKCFNQNSVFLSLLQEELELVKFSLSKYLSEGNRNIQEIENRFIRLKKTVEFEYLISRFKSDLMEELMKALSMPSNEDLRSELLTSIKVKYERIGALIAYNEIVKKHQESLSVIAQPSFHLEVKESAASVRLVDNDQKQRTNIPNPFNLPKELTDAINIEINRFKSQNRFFTIGMRKKEILIQQALTRAMNNLDKFQTIDDFINFREQIGNERLPSIKAALNNPRKWPGLEPLWGETDAWRNVKTAIDQMSFTRLTNG